MDPIRSNTDSIPAECEQIWVKDLSQIVWMQQKCLEIYSDNDVLMYNKSKQGIDKGKFAAVAQK